MITSDKRQSIKYQESYLSRHVSAQLGNLKFYGGEPDVDIDRSSGEPIQHLTMSFAYTALDGHVYTVKITQES